VAGAMVVAEVLDVIQDDTMVEDVEPQEAATLGERRAPMTTTPTTMVRRNSRHIKWAKPRMLHLNL